MIVARTPDEIKAFQLLALKGALKLESLGLKRRWRPASVVVREVLGSKTRDKATLLKEFEDHLRSIGVLR